MRTTLLKRIRKNYQIVPNNDQGSDEDILKSTQKIYYKYKLLNHGFGWNYDHALRLVKNRINREWKWYFFLTNPHRWTRHRIVEKRRRSEIEKNKIFYKNESFTIKKGS